MSDVDLRPLIAAAGKELIRVAKGVPDEALSADTPCEKFDVQGLLTHLLYWAPVFQLAAAKEPVPADRPAEGAQDLAVGDWQTLLADQIGAVAAAWDDPAAWEGMTSIGRADLGDLPAAFVGSLVLTEYSIHGWDLARATGGSFDCDEGVAQAAFGILSQTAEHGRASGAFGSEVLLPADCSVLDRALGVSGRDPNWPAQRS